MFCYFDSSFVLSALFEERAAADHAPWDQAEQRLSSDLLRFECWVATRRAGAMQPADTPRGWVEERMERLVSFFDRITFKTMDPSIEEVVRGETSLSGCRTLDAIHLATALYFAPHLDGPLIVCSFDARLRAAAGTLNLRVHPPLEPEIRT
jgi:hypothetical protein